MILGLDLSTVVCGICMLDHAGAVFASDFLEFKGTNLYQKLDALEARLSVGQFSHIFIEEPLKRMSRRRSTANTICLLQRWNGMVSGMLYKRFGIEPQLLDAQASRRKLGIVLPWKMDRKQCKDLILAHVQREAPQLGLWETKRTGRPKDYCYDMADAYVIAKAGYANTHTFAGGSR